MCARATSARELGEIAKLHPERAIGSYPFFDDKRGPNTNLVVRSRDAAQLAAAKADIEAMLVRVRAAMNGAPEPPSRGPDA